MFSSSGQRRRWVFQSVGLITVLLAGLHRAPAKEAFDLTLRDVGLKGLSPVGPDYAWGFGKLGFYLNGHGLPDHHVTFAILYTPAHGKPELIWPAFAYGNDFANAAVLDGRLVFAAGMADHTPVLMAHSAGSPPLVISPAVLRLAAQRLRTGVVVPGQDYYFSQVRLPPGRIWLKASKRSGDFFGYDKAFSVELTSTDLTQVMQETLQRGRKLKSKRFEYIAEPCSFTHLEGPVQGTNAPVQVARVVGPYVPEDERLYGAGLVDSVHHYAYFSTVHQPGRILKVALGESLMEAPRVVGAVVFEPEENDCFYGTLESDGGYAYFVAKYGKVVKLALGESNAPPRRVGSVLVDDANGLRVSVADSKLGYGCFAGRGKLYKLKLGTGEELPAVVSSLALPDRSEEMDSAVLDPATHQAYFGSEYNHIYKVAIGPDESAPRLLGQLEVPRGQGGFRGALLDSAAGCAWFISNDGYIQKIHLGDGEQPPRLLGTLAMPRGFRYLEHTFGRDNAGYGYFGTVSSGDSDGAVLKVDLGRTAQELPRIVSTLPLKPGEDYIAGGVADLSARILCLGLGTGPCCLEKLSMGQDAATPEVINKTVLSR